MTKYDLSWGNSVCVRQSFLRVAKTDKIIFGQKELESFDYPKHEGDNRLIELTRKVLFRQLGREYKYVILTNGAAGGVTIALRAFQKQGSYQCWIEDPPYFSLYPSMVSSAGLILCHRGIDSKEELYHPVYLIHSPKNPENTFSTEKKSLYNFPIVWDAVYHNNVYANGIGSQPDHDVVVGSYSKLTGLNGVRVGWVATNDPITYDRLVDLVTGEYCGLDNASTAIIMQTAGKFDDLEWTLFETIARSQLDANREEWSKLEKYFEGKPVDPIGMFYYAPMDKACKKLLDKSCIVWSKGSGLGTNDSFGRINLGQDCKLTRQAVKEVLKNDRR